jgi:DNA-binding NarL/FixJ family response regulator
VSAITIVIVDDHPVVRAGLRALLEREPDFAIVAEACSGLEAIDVVRRLEPRVVLMDYAMPGMDGPTATRAIVRTAPHSDVVLLVTLETAIEIERGRTAGAAFVVRKDASRAEIVRVVRAARLSSRR